MIRRNGMGEISTLLYIGAQHVSNRPIQNVYKRQTLVCEKRVGQRAFSERSAMDKSFLFSRKEKDGSVN